MASLKMMGDMGDMGDFWHYPTTFRILFCYRYIANLTRLL